MKNAIRTMMRPENEVSEMAQAEMVEALEALRPLFGMLDGLLQYNGEHPAVILVKNEWRKIAPPLKEYMVKLRQKTVVEAWLNVEAENEEDARRIAQEMIDGDIDGYDEGDLDWEEDESERMDEEVTRIVEED